MLLYVCFMIITCFVLIIKSFLCPFYDLKLVYFFVFAYNINNKHYDEFMRTSKNWHPAI